MIEQQDIQEFPPILSEEAVAHVSDNEEMNSADDEGSDNDNKED
jgi:hypothetical protein